MKIITPKPFTFTSGNRAVLLLHGFTGHSADVRMLGRFLETKGYTSHAPVYSGHGVPPEELLETGPSDWWKDACDAYDHLVELGYKEIAAVGLSLGGIMALKLGTERPLKGIVTMCSPMYFRSEEVMFQGVLSFAENYKKREGKDSNQIALEMEQIENHGMNTLKDLQAFMYEVKEQLDNVYAPILVVQSVSDEMINPDSANIIYNEVSSHKKMLKWFENSPHAITLGREKELLHEEILQFLMTLDWETTY